MRVYRGVTIEPPDHRGYYRALVLIGPVRGGYYVPVQADSFEGIRDAIRETLAANGQTREAMI